MKESGANKADSVIIFFSVFTPEHRELKFWVYGWVYSLWCLLEAVIKSKPPPKTKITNQECSVRAALGPGWQGGATDSSVEVITAASLAALN